MDPNNHGSGLKPTSSAGKASNHGNGQHGGEGPNRMDQGSDGLKKLEAMTKTNVLRDQRSDDPGTKHSRAERGKEKVEESELNCGQETGTRRRAEMLQPEIIHPRDRLTYQNHQILKLEFKEEMRWEKKENRWR
ncbi:hypothetical protein OIU76_028854 [Salix suchowensis]|nr:hypothetical protein OIU76_028854 [Salix suchowensis]